MGGLHRWAHRRESICDAELGRRALQGTAFRLTCSAKYGGSSANNVGPSASAEVEGTSEGSYSVRSCAGQPWLLCRAHTRLHEGSNCSAARVELWGQPGLDGQPIRLDAPPRASPRTVTRLVRIRGKWTNVTVNTTVGWVERPVKGP